MQVRYRAAPHSDTIIKLYSGPGYLSDFIPGCKPYKARSGRNVVAAQHIPQVAQVAQHRLKDRFLLVA